MPAALVEIVVGALAGNIPGIREHVTQTDVVTFLASAGSLVLTFLAGAEIDPVSLRGHWKASLSIGLVSFALPFLAAFGFCGLVLGWHLHAAEIGGIALSTTSVAVVYAVMVETGLNRRDLGKLILAACFITDLGTVLALGGLFATYSWLLIVFVAVSAVTVLLLPGCSGWRSPVSATGSLNRRSSCCWSSCSGSAGWPPRRAARQSCPPTSPGWSSPAAPPHGRQPGPDRRVLLRPIGRGPGGARRRGTAGLTRRRRRFEDAEPTEVVPEAVRVDETDRPEPEAGRPLDVAHLVVDEDRLPGNHAVAIRDQREDPRVRLDDPSSPDTTIASNQARNG